MQAVKILAKEHEVILEMLDNLAAARDMLEKRNRPPKEFFEKAIVFARDFTDSFHHFKEEYLLFSLLAQKKEGAFDGEHLPATRMAGLPKNNPVVRCVVVMLLL